MLTQGRAVRRHRVLTCLLITLQGTACQTWRTEGIAPQAVVTTHQPTKLRVTRTDGSQLVLRHPALRGDTLVGIGRSQDGPGEVRIPLEDVQHVAVRTFSAGRTVGLGLGVAAAVGVAILAAIKIGCASGACSN